MPNIKFDINILTDYLNITVKSLKVLKENLFIPLNKSSLGIAIAFLY